MVDHLQEKYGRNGYLKLWFDNSPNALRLEELRDMMDDESLLRQLFDRFLCRTDNLSIHLKRGGNWRE